MKACVLAALMLLLCSGGAAAHPGRLDAEGCHHVRKDFRYASGRIAKAGEFHCHRLVTGKPMVLDGREVLMESRVDVERERSSEEEMEERAEEGP